MLLKMKVYTGIVFILTTYFSLSIGKTKEVPTISNMPWRYTNILHSL